MEQNVVQFILDNMMFFLPLGIIGIVSTFILYFTSERDEKNRHLKDVDLNVNLFNRKINCFLLIYIFVFIMMILIGFFSEFYVATTIGGCIAFVPIIILLLSEYTKLFTRGKTS